MAQVERRGAGGANSKPGSTSTHKTGRAPVTDRVNVEPTILNGMNATEAKVIALCSGVVFFVIGLIIWGCTGVWQILLVVAIFGPAAAMWYGSSYLAGIKRGRPDGYYGQAIHFWLLKRNLTSPIFLVHNGYWSLGQELDVDLSSHLDMRKGPDERTAIPKTHG